MATGRILARTAMDCGCTVWTKAMRPNAASREKGRRNFSDAANHSQ